MQEQNPHSLVKIDNEDLQKVFAYEELFRILLLKYKVCISCVYRIFSIMTPKIYSQEANFVFICKEIMNIGEKKCMQEGVKQVYKFLFAQFKAAFEQNKLFATQQFCWLCSGILQTPFLQRCSKLSMQTISSQGYTHKTKYKLNVKIHNVLNIKFQIFCNIMLSQLQNQQLVPLESIQKMRKQLIVPLFQKTGLDIKTVFKWKLSHLINQQPAEIFTLCSTINQDEQSVIVSLDIQNLCAELEEAMTHLLGPFLGLQKVKNKKSKIQLNEDIHYEVVWTQGLIAKMLQIVPLQWMSMLETKIIEKIRKIEKNDQFLNIKIGLQSQNIFFSGKYVKFSRYLSQTPWVINKERLTESSLQQLVQSKILRFFYPEAIPENKIVIKFHAGGREDIDVRMLKGGRPFVLQFVNPRNCLSDIKISTILEKIAKQYPEQSKKLPVIEDTYEGMEAELIKCNLLEFYINSSTELAKVNTFRRTDSSFISKELKQAQIEKIKHYVCYIKTWQEFTQEDKQKLQSCYNLPVLQKTPVRVLHRRTLMYRDKTIHKMIFHLVSKKSAVLQIWGSAGTYIKEFVHGDLGRTMPNVGSLLGKQVDILQLDVGSLKEGEWQQGAHQNMKLGTLPWEQS